MNLTRLAYVIPCRDGVRFAMTVSCGGCGLIPGNTEHAVSYRVERFCPQVMRMVDLTAPLACRQWVPRGETLCET